MGASPSWTPSRSSRTQRPSMPWPRGRSTRWTSTTRSSLLLAAWVERSTPASTRQRRSSMPDSDRGSPSAASWPPTRGRRSALIAGSTVLRARRLQGCCCRRDGRPAGDRAGAARRPRARSTPSTTPSRTHANAFPSRHRRSADANKLLADAQRAMAQGDTEEAERLLAEAEALLGDARQPRSAEPDRQAHGELVGTSHGSEGPGSRADAARARVQRTPTGQGSGTSRTRARARTGRQGKGPARTRARARAPTRSRQGKGPDQDKGKDVPGQPGANQEPGTSASGNPRPAVDPDPRLERPEESAGLAEQARRVREVEPTKG